MSVKEKVPFLIDHYKEILAGKKHRFPKHTWDQPDSKELAVILVRYLIEDVLRWSKEDILEKVTSEFIVKYGFRGMLHLLFDASHFELFNAAYPNKFKPWEMKISPNHTWSSKAEGGKAVKWLLEENFKWSDEEIKNKYTVDLLEEHNLGGMIRLFQYNPYLSLEEAYPGRFKPWELAKVPLAYWKTDNNCIKATKWLIEEKLNWSDDEVKEKLTQYVFQEHGLAGMLVHEFHNSPYLAIENAYPNKFKPNNFKKSVSKQTLSKYKMSLLD